MRINKRYLIEYSDQFKRYSILLFFIWPIAALIFSLKNYKLEWTKNIFWLFCIFFGFTFVVSTYEAADSGFYAHNLEYFHNSDIRFVNIWKSFYSKGANVDIASPVLIYFISRFTDNLSILFLIFGLIFGFFYSRNIWYILTRIQGKHSFIILLLVLVYILLNPIWNINGFRFNTASQIFVFGLLPFLFEGNTKKLFWCILAAFVHFSFFFPLIILAVFLLLKKQLNLFFTIFFITSLINEINLTAIRNLTSYLPGFLQGKILQYSDPVYIEAVNLETQKLNWFMPLSDNGLRWFILASSIAIFVKYRKDIVAMSPLHNLLGFSLLMLSFSNISNLIPSGNRFVILASLFYIPFLIIYISNSEQRRLSKLGLVFTPFLLLYCVVAIRLGMDHYSYVTLIGNPVTALIYSNASSLINLINGF